MRLLDLGHVAAHRVAHCDEWAGGADERREMGERPGDGVGLVVPRHVGGRAGARSGAEQVDRQHAEAVGGGVLGEAVALTSGHDHVEVVPVVGAPRQAHERGVPRCPLGREPAAGEVGRSAVGTGGVERQVEGRHLPIVPSHGGADA